MITEEKIQKEIDVRFKKVYKLVDTTDELMELHSKGSTYFLWMATLFVVISFFPYSKAVLLFAEIGWLAAFFGHLSHVDKKNIQKGKLKGIRETMDVLFKDIKKEENPVPDAEIDLPTDPDEQREKLIDIENNIGVVLRIRIGKAIVKKYKK